MKRKLTKEEIAMRIAMDIPEGSYVNLGIGVPTLVAKYIPADREVIVHSENGILGVGAPATGNEIDNDIIDASKVPVTLVKGAALLDHVMSFGFIVGHHLDLTVLGALQVSERGDIANWQVPGDAVPGVGGAMDLCSGARRVVVAMTHTDRDGRPKILNNCTFPLTAKGKVRAIYTDLAVIDVKSDGLHLREIAPGWTVEEVQALTEAPLRHQGMVPAVNLESGVAA